MAKYIDSIEKKVKESSIKLPKNFKKNGKVLVKQLQDIMEKSKSVKIQYDNLKQLIDKAKKIYNIQSTVNDVVFKSPLNNPDIFENKLSFKGQGKLLLKLDVSKEEIRSTFEAILDQAYRCVYYSIRAISWFHSKDINEVGEFLIFTRKLKTRCDLVSYFISEYNQWIKQLQDIRGMSYHFSTIPQSDLQLELDGSSNSPVQKYFIVFGRHKNERIDLEKYCDSLCTSAFCFSHDLIRTIDENH